MAVMVWASALEVDGERLERLFPARASVPGSWATEVLEVAHGEVEHFQRRLLGRDRPRLRAALRSQALIDSIRFVV